MPTLNATDLILVELARIFVSPYASSDKDEEEISESVQEVLNEIKPYGLKIDRESKLFTEDKFTKPTLIDLAKKRSMYNKKYDKALHALEEYQKFVTDLNKKDEKTLEEINKKAKFYLASREFSDDYFLYVDDQRKKHKLFQEALQKKIPELKEQLDNLHKLCLEKKHLANIFEIIKEEDAKQQGPMSQLLQSLKKANNPSLEFEKSIKDKMVNICNERLKSYEAWRNQQLEDINAFRTVLSVVDKSNTEMEAKLKKVDISIHHVEASFFLLAHAIHYSNTYKTRFQKLQKVLETIPSECCENVKKIESEILSLSTKVVASIKSLFESHKPKALELLCERLIPQDSKLMDKTMRNLCSSNETLLKLHERFYEACLKKINERIDLYILSIKENFHKDDLVKKTLIASYIDSVNEISDVKSHMGGLYACHLLVYFHEATAYYMDCVEGDVLKIVQLCEKFDIAPTSEIAQNTLQEQLQQDCLNLSSGLTFEAVKNKDKKIQYELEQKKREERKNQRNWELYAYKKSQGERVKRDFKIAEDKRSAEALLTACKDLNNERIEWLCNIIDKPHTLHEKISYKDFISLIIKLKPFKIEDTKQGFILCFHQDVLGSTHRDHTQDKSGIHGDILAAVSKQFKVLDISTNDIRNCVNVSKKK